MAEEPLDGEDIVGREEREGRALPADIAGGGGSQGEEAVELPETHAHREQHKHAEPPPVGGRVRAEKASHGGRGGHGRRCGGCCCGGAGGCRSGETHRRFQQAKG